MAEQDINPDDEDPKEELEDDADIDAQAEEGEEGEGGEEDLPKPSKLKKLLVVIIPLVLIIGGGAGAYFMGVLDPLLGIEDKKTALEGELTEEENKNKQTVFLTVPDMIVNLRGSNTKQQRYLKLRVELELNSETDKAEVEKVAPRVIDHFQTYLRELRVRDLEGSQGIYRLRQELLARVNAAAYPIEVEDVLFQEILIQ